VRFADVVGNEHVKEVLRRAADRDRVPHAWMFTGPDGVGKRTMALAFLSYLVCRDRRDGDSCGVCRSCNQMTAGAYADLQVLSPEKGYIKLEPLKESMPRLFYPALTGPWKCLLIDDAHTLTNEAANAALKTLEEPPSMVMFVLVTPSPDLLPRTVLSRCFEVPFGPLTNDEVVGFLESRGRTGSDAWSAASLSRGSPGRALQFLDSPVLTDRTEFLTSFLDLAESDAGPRLKFADEVGSSKDETADRMLLVESIARDVLRASAGLSDDMLSNRDLAYAIRAFADRVGPDRAVDMATAWLDWDATRRFVPNVRAAMDRLLQALPNPPPTVRG
jgi:DNA polymerase-3 subunit delta'